MITFFTIPKPFEGHIGLIQRNAILSWKNLSPSPEIIMFGNEKGMADFASENGIRHEPDLKLNEFGTPLLDDAFAKAARLAKKGNRLCYINADIILLQDIIDTVTAVSAMKLPKDFLIIGDRHDVDITEPIDFATEWQPWVKERVASGKLVKPAYDYFLYSENLFRDIPPFAVGRLAFDIWFVYEAVKQKASVIDAAGLISCIHQNHNYAHVTGKDFSSRKDLKGRRSPEIRENRRLCGNDLLRLCIPFHKIKGNTLQISVKETFINFLYSLRRNITWRLKKFLD